MKDFLRANKNTVVDGEPLSNHEGFGVSLKSADAMKFIERVASLEHEDEWIVKEE